MLFAYLLLVAITNVTIGFLCGAWIHGLEIGSAQAIDMLDTFAETIGRLVAPGANLSIRGKNAAKQQAFAMTARPSGQSTTSNRSVAEQAQGSVGTGSTATTVRSKAEQAVAADGSEAKPSRAAPAAETFGSLNQFASELKRLDELMGQTLCNQDKQFVQRVISNLQSLLQLQLVAWAKASQPATPNSDAKRADAMVQLVTQTKATLQITDQIHSSGDQEEIVAVVRQELTQLCRLSEQAM